MTEQDIKNMATIAFAECDHIPNTKIPKEFVIAFAHLVANKEREACVKVCENLDFEPDGEGWSDGVEMCINAILDRGQE